VVAALAAACSTGAQRPGLPDPAAVSGTIAIDGASTSTAGADPARLTGYLGGRALRLQMVVGEGLPTPDVVAVEVDVLDLDGTGAQDRAAVITTLRQQATGTDSGGGLEPAARSGPDCTARLADVLAAGEASCSLIPVDGGAPIEASIGWTGSEVTDVAPLALRTTWELTGDAPGSGEATLWTSPESLVRPADDAIVLPQVLVAGDALAPSVLRVTVRGSDGAGTSSDIEAVLDGSVTESVPYTGTPIGWRLPDLVLAAFTGGEDGAIEFSDCSVELAMDATQGDLTCARGGPGGDGSATLHLRWAPEPAD
jgi:hypothetical protein